MSKAMTLYEAITEIINKIDFVIVVRCKECKHKYIEDMVWSCPFGLPGGEDFFCAYGAKDGDSDEAD